MTETSSAEAQRELHRVQQVLDDLPALVVVVGPDERNEYSNQAARRWLGRTPEQARGHTVRELLGDEGYAAVQARVAAALAGERQSFERAVRTTDGKVMHTWTEYLPRFEDGHPHGFVVLSTDITRQVRAERAQLSSQRELELLRERNRDAVRISDDALQELFALGLHLQRVQRFSASDWDGAAPVVETLASTIDRLRSSIQRLLVDEAGGSDGSGAPTPAADPAAYAWSDEPTPEAPVTELSEAECWALLADQEIGRLAFRLVDELHVVPVNFALDGHRVLVRTAAGSKLLAAALHGDVAFEVDWYGQRSAWSVVVRGRLRRLGEDEARRLDDLAPRPWLATLKYDVVEIEGARPSGRRFHLERPTAESGPSSP